jgi:hypothetical protein
MRIINKVHLAQAVQKRPVDALARNHGFIRSMLPGFDERGRAFFFYQFVFSGAHNNTRLVRGNHEYLPKLLCSRTQEAPEGFINARTALEKITAAAGLAGLANSTCAPNLIPEAYKLYGSAIRHIRCALEDPNQAHADETLAVVMLMGTFEVSYTSS